MILAAARANAATALTGGRLRVAGASFNANVNNNVSLPQAGD